MDIDARHDIHGTLTTPRHAVRLLRLPDVLARVGLGRSAIYAAMRAGHIPTAGAARRSVLRLAVR